MQKPNSKKKIFASKNTIYLIVRQGWENQDGFYIDGCTTYTCTQAKGKTGIWVERPDL